MARIPGTLFSGTSAVVNGETEWTQNVGGAGGGGGGFPADSYSTGTIAAATLNAAYTITIGSGQNTSAFIVSGLTASGATLVLEGSNDNGVTWTNAFSANGGTGIITNTFTADGGFSANVAARTRLRLRVSIAGTGTITVSSNTSVATRGVTIDAPLPPGTNTIGAVLVAVLPATTDRSGTATTTSGGLNVPANANRRSLVGQNISGVAIGFNEQGGTAAIGTVGTYSVPAGSGFSISTNKLINFVAASGTAAVTMTET